jgi:hypothetical protein
MVHPLWKTLWQFLKALNIELLYGPAILLLGTHPRETKTHAHRKLVHKHSSSIIHSSQKADNASVH